MSAAQRKPWGARKAQVGSMLPGEPMLVATHAEAKVLYSTARRMQARLSIRALKRGQPAQRVTLLP